MAHDAFTAKEEAIDEFAEQFGLDRQRASRIVTRLISAAAVEATTRVTDELVDGLKVSNDKAHKAFGDLLKRVDRELTGR